MKREVVALGPDGLGAFEFDSATFRMEPIPTSGAWPESLVVPGFVDIHTHGAFGIDFMRASREEMGTLCEKLAEVGYEAFLPTTVSASAEDVTRALGALPEHPMVLGFHLEGPFISPQFPGAQPPSAIIAPPDGPSEWDPILDDGRLCVVTLAPEIPGALGLINRLAIRGVAVSLGHTAATYDQCRAAFAKGARHTTHTFNAMRPLHHREPGTVGFSMTEDEVFSELIYDRIHVTRAAAEVLVRSKPRRRLLAVSDSTMAAGLPPGTELKMWGLESIVGDGDVRLRDGTLAGSAITLYDAFRNMVADFGWETAILACCINPRHALGMDPTKCRTCLEINVQGRIIDRFECAEPALF
jgi:N-acetylglucosamine-6-phosphate deacetylase